MITPRSVPRLVAIGVVALASIGCSTSASGADPSPAVAPPTSEERIRVSGSGAALPLVQKLAEAYGRERPSVSFEFVPGTNSGGAIKGLTERTLDIAVVNRSLDAEEAAQPLEYHPLARDAVVFVAHRADSPLSLKRSEIAAIYAGRITDWSELGAAPGPIIVLDRDPDESVRKQILLPIMEGSEVFGRTVVLTTAKAMVEALANTPDSIGYTTQALLRIHAPAGVAVVGMDGAAPTAETLADGSYDLAMTFALVVRSDADEVERAFLVWTTSPAGAALVSRYGAIPFRP